MMQTKFAPTVAPIKKPVHDVEQRKEQEDVRQEATPDDGLGVP